MAALEGVKEAFKLYDQDGSGAISREELQKVLQGLDSEQWDIDSIDELLASADKSGDGQLQIDEFVNWIFAEDEEIRGDANINFQTLEIRFCSREEFNGVYEPTKEFYFHRPVFYCKANDMVMFYHGKREQWQIYWRTSAKASVRLKTKRVPHLEHGLSWSVWKRKKNSKKKSWVKERKLECRIAPPHISSPESVKLPGFVAFVKTDQVLCDCAVYKYNGDSTWPPHQRMRLFYSAENKQWICGELGSNQHFLFLSDPCMPCDPSKVQWLKQTGSEDAIKVTLIVPDEDDKEKLAYLKADCGPIVERLKNVAPQGWVDPDFPPNDESIGKTVWKETSTRMGRPYRDKEFHWIRATEANNISDQPLCLWDNIEPVNFMQGSMGDCWLIAALASVAEFPDYFKNNVFVTQELQEDGKYQVKLFADDEWKVWDIDDLLVCSDPYTPRGTTETLFRTEFVKLHEGQLYLALIEKAFAKAHGSWGELYGGQPTNAWMHVTGCKDMFSMRWRRRPTYAPEDYVDWEITADRAYVRSGPSNKSMRIGKLSKGCIVQELKMCEKGWIKFKKISGESDEPEEGFFRYYTAGQRVATRDGFWDADRTQVIMLENSAVYDREPIHGHGLPDEEAEIIGQWQAGTYLELVEKVDVANNCCYKLKKGLARAQINCDDVNVPDEGWVMGKDPDYNQMARELKWCTVLNFWTYTNTAFGKEVYAIPSDREWRLELTSEEAWQRLLEMDRANYLLAGSNHVSTGRTETGFVCNHSYSILHAVEVEGFKLVCLRNPWGKTEWNGPWADTSEEWELHPSIAETLKAGLQSDGMFWMDFEDFMNNFEINGLEIEMSSKRGAFHMDIVDEDDEEEAERGVTSCTGLDIEWNAPAKMTEGTLVNPGERNYIFENIPPFMSGGTYIGSKTWPSAGTWTIDYEAPTTLYVWVEAGEYNAGVDDALSTDGWHREEVGEFQRVGDAGVNPLRVWSRQFHTGSTYSIVTNGLMVGGVVSSEE